MVVSDIDPDTLTGKLILKPNFSWSWRANLYFLYTLMGVSLVINSGFLLAGVWAVLPWSVLELGFLWLCIYYCVRRCYRQEVITILEHEVIIESGITRRLTARNFNRSWSQFLVKRARHPWDPEVVSIRSHGEELEIGSFLSKPDKTQLIQQLRHLVYG